MRTFILSLCLLLYPALAAAQPCVRGAADPLSGTSPGIYYCGNDDAELPVSAKLLGTKPYVNRDLSTQHPSGFWLDFALTVAAKGQFIFRPAVYHESCQTNPQYCLMDFSAKQAIIADESGNIIQSWPDPKCFAKGIACEQTEFLSVNLQPGEYRYKILLQSSAVQQEYNDGRPYYCYGPGDRLAMQGLLDVLKPDQKINLHYRIYYGLNGQGEKSINGDFDATGIAPFYKDVLSKGFSDCQ